LSNGQRTRFGAATLIFRAIVTRTNASNEPTVLTRSGTTWHDNLLAKTAVNAWTGDYLYLETRGRDFVGIFAADNRPDHANFPHGVHYQRKANFTTHQLLEATGTTMIPPSIDPFFFKLPRRKEDDEDDDDE